MLTGEAAGGLSDGNVPGQALQGEAADGSAPEDAAQTGGQAGNVKTGDSSTWEILFFLFVLSGIVIVAEKIRRLNMDK